MYSVLSTVKCKIAILSIFVMACAGQPEEILCKARPGCHLAKCDPVHSWKDLDTNEYPISCVRPSVEDSAYQAENDELKKQMEHLQTDLKVVKSQLSRSMEENRELSTEVNAIRKQMTQSNENNQKMTAEIDTVKKQMTQSKESNQEMTAQLKVVKSQLSQSIEENRELSADLVVMKRQLSQLSKSTQQEISKESNEMKTDTLKNNAFAITNDCTDSPRQYNGTIGITASGKICQRWDSDFPHKPKHTPFDGPNHNYCRNPLKDAKGAWCHTVDNNVRWEYCNITKCVVFGVYGEWTQWGSCSHPCNYGTRTRIRHCIGGSCLGLATDLESCNAVSCLTVLGNGRWTQWSAFGPCNASCGGTRVSTRTCIGGQSPSACGSGDSRKEVACPPCRSAIRDSSSPIGSSSTTGISENTSPCVVDNSEKRQCIPDDVPKEICQTLGCCYDNSSIAQGVPACYHKT